MAHNSDYTIIYTKSGEGLSIAEVARSLGSGSRDLGTLCKSNQIEKWALHKPIKHTSLAPITVDQIYSKDCGLSVPGADSVVGCLASMQSAWQYEKPTGGQYPYRLLDFDKYCDTARPPLSVGIRVQDGYRLPNYNLDPNLPAKMFFDFALNPARGITIDGVSYPYEIDLRRLGVFGGDALSNVGWMAKVTYDSVEDIVGLDDNGHIMYPLANSSDNPLSYSIEYAMTQGKTYAVALGLIKNNGHVYYLDPDFGVGYKTGIQPHYISSEQRLNLSVVLYAFEIVETGKPKIAVRAVIQNTSTSAQSVDITFTDKIDYATGSNLSPESSLSRNNVSVPASGSYVYLPTEHDNYLETRTYDGDSYAVLRYEEDKPTSVGYNFIYYIKAAKTGTNTYVEDKTTVEMNP